MDNCITLKSVFASSKDNLTAKLSGLSLPKDSSKVQTVVSEFLGDLFENDGSFRQSLTESEDFILQASLRLLQAQQQISLELTKALSKPVVSAHSNSKKKESSSLSLAVGAGVGAFTGSFIGTWAAVAGAIAGTALAIYCSTYSKPVEATKDKDVEKTFLDTEVFCDIIENICKCVDGVIETYRVQVKRIENIYEQKESPSILSQCESLLSQVANVSKAVESNKENVPTKVINAVEMLVESLENYNLTIENGKVVSLK